MGQLSKEIILQEVTGCSNPVCFQFKCLRFPFGYKRVDGFSLMVSQLITPSKTEESLSFLSNDEILRNIALWSIENGLEGFYEDYSDQYTFRVKKDYDRH